MWQTARDARVIRQGCGGSGVTSDLPNAPQPSSAAAKWVGESCPSRTGARTGARDGARDCARTRSHTEAAWLNRSMSREPRGVSNIGGDCENGEMLAAPGAAALTAPLSTAGRLLPKLPAKLL